MFTVNPHVQSRLERGSWANVEVQTRNSVYHFAVDRSSTRVYATAGGSIIADSDGRNATGIRSIDGVELIGFVAAVLKYRPCDDCDSYHDSADLTDIFVGRPLTFKVNGRAVITSTVKAITLT